MGGEVQITEEKIEATHSALPWSLCGADRGGCQCCSIWEGGGSHPVCKAERGNWGDDYPSLRFVKDTGGEGSIMPKVEAYMEQITYGTIDLDVARANARLIVRAVNNHDALIKSVEALLINMKADGGEYRDCYINANTLLESIKSLPHSGVK
jgi:hypothetical protein